MKDNIKKLYPELKNKIAFCIAVSEEVGIKPESIYQNWFSRFWAIPEKHLALVLTMLQNQLAEDALAA